MMSEGQEMRLAFLSGLILIAASGGPVLAQGACTVAGTPYASGASLCQPAVRDGRIEQMLFTCEDGAWTNANAVCPDEYAYFCRIGAHAVPVGETLLLGAGPARLECQFPGVLELVQGSDPGEVGMAPSMLVRGVQLFLAGEGAGIDCAVDACDGRADAKTLTALASFVRRNFANLSDEEKAAFGASDAAAVEAVLLARSPIDVIPVFARVFDVPPAQ
jgi:hypothetical protein